MYAIVVRFGVRASGACYRQDISLTQVGLLYCPISAQARDLDARHRAPGPAEEADDEDVDDAQVGRAKACEARISVSETASSPSSRAA